VTLIFVFVFVLFCCDLVVEEKNISFSGWYKRKVLSIFSFLLLRAELAQLLLCLFSFTSHKQASFSTKKKDGGTYLGYGSAIYFKFILKINI
jgi:hypothetical protein